MDNFATEWKIIHPSCIGIGAFARVYRVWYTKEQKYCACKVSENLNILRGEAGVLREMNHPLFPGFFDYWEAGNKGYLLMEYIDGENLETLLEAGKKFTEEEVVAITYTVAEGLCFLHERREQLVYFDLKPQNILLDKYGKVRLVDLGSVHSVADSMEVITGTREYAAPEQFYHRMVKGTAADIYGLGRLMQRLLSGSRMHAGLRRLIKGCIEPNQINRIPSVRWILLTLRTYCKAGKMGRLWINLGSLLRRRWEMQYQFRRNTVIWGDKS